MKSEELFTLLSEVDEEKVLEVKDRLELETMKILPKRRSYVYRWGLVAACLVLVVGIAAPKVFHTKKMEMKSVQDASVSFSQDANKEKMYKYEANELLTMPYTNDTEATHEPAFVNDGLGNEENAGYANGHSEGTLKNRYMSRYADRELVLYEDDKSVQNGDVEFSRSLQDAINDFGEEYTYRVFVSVFKDGKEVPIDSQLIEGEITSFDKEGFTVVLETVGSADGLRSTTYFTIFATADEINNFIHSDDYGYYVMFYDEYFGDQGIVVPEGDVYNSIEMK